MVRIEYLQGANIRGSTILIFYHHIVVRGTKTLSACRFNSVQTVSILSGRLQYCLDGFNTVRTVSILSGGFH